VLSEITLHSSNRSNDVGELFARNGVLMEKTLLGLVELVVGVVDTVEQGLGIIRRLVDSLRIGTRKCVELVVCVIDTVEYDLGVLCSLLDGVRVSGRKGRQCRSQGVD
jgi:hypothetical protein